MSLGLGLASPGIVVKEVDLTKGSTLQQNENVGVIAGPFTQGPVLDPILIRNEDELIKVFGKPTTKNDQQDYYLSAESFLAYGGVLKVIRCDSTSFKNASIARYTGTNIGVGSTNGDVDIPNHESYLNNSSTGWEWASKNSGSWGNSLKVCVIDDLGDQILSGSGIATANVAIGNTITVTLSGSRTSIGIGTTSSWDIATTIQGVVTSIGSSSITAKWNTYTASNSTTVFQYKKNSNYEAKSTDGSIVVAGVGTVGVCTTNVTIQDWYDQQTLTTNTNIYWKSIAEKPVSSAYAVSRGSYNDSLHVVVVDTTGSVRGQVGDILEKFTFLSKSTDASLSGKGLYYKERIASDSNFIYAGSPQTGIISKSGITTTSSTWGKTIQDSPITFNVIGNVEFKLSGGSDYSLTDANAYVVSPSDLDTAYRKILNPEEHKDIDYLIYGPSLPTKEQSQAKANTLISIAEQRKDCIAVISPNKDAVVGTTDSNKQTEKIIEFFNGVTPSSYAVFDSGYKYIFDRFSSKFRYISCNADVAGIMAKTTTDFNSWYSPAGTVRGVVRNALKLAYNPTQSQRDELYVNRVNPIIQQSTGVILFGDKTAVAYQTSFDRINVRRLFIEIEQTISEVAKSFLFEFNDEFTRSSFVSQVDPYLRDIEAKRGIQEYVLVCDETNNTPEVIDRNEFVAEVYIKPSRSINFIGLTFVATRSGISFEEVIGRF